MTEKRYTIGQFAKEINRSTQTLRRWDRDGTLPAKRVCGGQRYYEESELHKALGLEAHPTDGRKTVVYCRVSSSHQKTDLQAQVDSMKEFCLASEMVVSEWIEEIGGVKLQEKRIVIAYGKDRKGTDHPFTHCTQRSADQIWF